MITIRYRSGDIKYLFKVDEMAEYFNHNPMLSVDPKRDRKITDNIEVATVTR